jgi:hypothetical protein
MSLFEKLSRKKILKRSTVNNRQFNNNSTTGHFIDELGFEITFDQNDPSVPDLFDILFG